MRLLLLLAICSLSACVPSMQDFTPTITGNWQYQVTETSSGNIYDQGSMHFSSSNNTGTFTLTNFYDIDSEGQYTLNIEEKTIRLNDSGITYDGHFSNPNSIRGSWEGNDTGGTWEANRQ